MNKTTLYSRASKTSLAALSLNVAGAASTTIKWVASIKLTEVVG